ncbi:MAG TPA: glycosyltransferase family 9 protein [bacterium]|nr:glycosyltransferase family 9 protein [bacterium]
MTGVEIDRDSIRRILVIKTSALGDIVRTFPALVSVAKHFQHAQISYMIGEQYVDVIEPCPYISEVIPYKKRRNMEDLSGFLRFASDIRKKRFDLVLNFQNTKRFDYLARISGAKYRTSIITLDRPIDGVEGVFKILNTVGVYPKRRYYEFWYTDDDVSFTQDFLERNNMNDGKKIIGLNPGVAWKSKQWPVEKYAELANRLVENTGAHIVVFGNEAERDRAEQILERANYPVAIAAGDTTIRQAACIISKCCLFVSNDSGLMHVAAIQDVPTLGLFGSTNPAYHGPCREGNLSIFHAVDCSPCYCAECRLEIEKYFCMRSITVDEVYKGARSIMH